MQNVSPHSSPVACASADARLARCIRVWMRASPLTDPDQLGAHLEGLRALFRAAILVNGRRIDISLAFGIDTDGSRSMSSRTGSALLCAEEALSTERLEAANHGNCGSVLHLVVPPGSVAYV